MVHDLTRSPDWDDAALIESSDGHTQGNRDASAVIATAGRSPGLGSIASEGQKAEMRCEAVLGGEAPFEPAICTTEGLIRLELIAHRAAEKQPGRNDMFGRQVVTRPENSRYVVAGA